MATEKRNDFEKEKNEYEYSGYSENNFCTFYEFNSTQYEHQVMFNKIENYFGSNDGVTHDMMWGIYVNDNIYYDYFNSTNVNEKTQNTLISIINNYIKYYSADSKTNYVRADFYPYTAENYKKAAKAFSVLVNNYGSKNVVQYDNREIYIQFD